MALLILGIALLLGLYMAWSIGANDVANSMADAVGSRAISVKKAVIVAGVCEFAGAVLVGTHVTDTVRKGIVGPEYLSGRPELLALGMACALLAAALWLHMASWAGLPVSTTHSIVGAVAGFGIVAAGWGAVRWGKMGAIAASWFLSPAMGAALGFILFKIISRLILGRDRPARAAVRIMPFIAFLAASVVTLATLYKGLTNLVAEGALWLTGPTSLSLAVAVGLIAALSCRLLAARYLMGKSRLPLAEQLEAVERTFAPLVVITSCAVAFAHGSNDVANAVGPLAAVVDIVRSGTVKMRVQVPPWILALGGAGIVLGLATYGYRVMHTVGTRITQITPSRGVAADVAATSVVLLCTRLKLPVSTTHVLVGAILGIGLARGLGAVNRRVMRSIFGAWLITVPAAGLLSVVLFVVARALLVGTLGQVLHAAAGAGP